MASRFARYISVAPFARKSRSPKSAMTGSTGCVGDPTQCRRNIAPNPSRVNAFPFRLCTNVSHTIFSGNASSITFASSPRDLDFDQRTLDLGPFVAEQATAVRQAHDVARAHRIQIGGEIERAHRKRHRSFH